MSSLREFNRLKSEIEKLDHIQEITVRVMVSNYSLLCNEGPYLAFVLSLRNLPVERKVTINMLYS